MLNKSILMGRLTRDPELRCTAGSNISVVSFTLAVERDFKDSSGERQSDFIDCVAWRGTAEFIERYFKKGQMMCIAGRLQKRGYEDKNGNKRYITEVVVDNAYFCGKKDDSSNRGNYTDVNTYVDSEPYYDTDSYNQASFSDFEEIMPDDGDLPF